MHEHFLAASQVATVKVCANTARIIGDALAHWQSRNRQRISCAEETKLPGWQYLVHSLLADESVATAWLTELNKIHAALAEQDRDSESGGVR